MVTEPDEPALGRLVDQITAGLSGREEKIQALLSFVTDEIAYSHREQAGTRETLKRSPEVLMTGEGDCSNKVILMASLLTRLGEPALLLYDDDHIAVAVAVGAFPQENGHHLRYAEQDWTILETTVSGFQIGTTRLTEPMDGETVRWVQAVEAEAPIVALRTGQVVPFE